MLLTLISYWCKLSLYVPLLPASLPLPILSVLLSAGSSRLSAHCLACCLLFTLARTAYEALPFNHLRNFSLPAYSFP